jgi:hypothetical protein
VNKASATQTAREDRPWKRALAWLVSLQESPRARDPRLKRVVLALASAFLVGGVVFALREHPDLWTKLDWRPILIVVALLVPAGIWLNTVEFIVTGRLIGQPIGFRRALEVTIIGSAANLFPLPGGTLVRVASLKAGGSRLKSGTLAVLFVATVWIGLALAYGGVFIILFRPGLAGFLFLAVGGALVIGLLWLGARAAGGPKTAAMIVLIKSVLVVGDSVRLFLCLLAIGVSASFVQAAPLAVAAPLGSTVSIVPAGLGLREALAGALSPLTGLAVASGFLATTLNRLLGFIIIIPLSFVLVARRPSEEAR